MLQYALDGFSWQSQSCAKGSGRMLQRLRTSYSDFFSGPDLMPNMQPMQASKGTAVVYWGRYCIYMYISQYIIVVSCALRLGVVLQLSHARRFPGGFQRRHR